MCANTDTEKHQCSLSISIIFSQPRLVFLFAQVYLQLVSEILLKSPVSPRKKCSLGLFFLIGQLIFILCICECASHRPCLKHNILCAQVSLQHVSEMLSILKKSHLPPNFFLTIFVWSSVPRRLWVNWSADITSVCMFMCMNCMLFLTTG